MAWPEGPLSHLTDFLFVCHPWHPILSQPCFSFSFPMSNAMSQKPDVLCNQDRAGLGSLTAGSLGVVVTFQFQLQHQEVNFQERGQRCHDHRDLSAASSWDTLPGCKAEEAASDPRPLVGHGSPNDRYPTDRPEGLWVTQVTLSWQLTPALSIPPHFLPR